MARIVPVVTEFRVEYLDMTKTPIPAIARSIPRWGKIELDKFRAVETIRPVLRAKTFHRLKDHVLIVRVVFEKDNQVVKTLHQTYPLDETVSLDTNGLSLRPFRVNRNLTGIWSVLISLGAFPKKLWIEASDEAKTRYLASIVFEDVAETERYWEVHGFEGEITDTDSTGMFQTPEQGRLIRESQETINPRDI